MDDLPKKCDRCGWDDPETQYVYVHQMGEPEPKETICKDCDMDERKLEYRKSRRLTTWLVTEATLAEATTKDGWRRGQTIDAVLSDLKELHEHVELFYTQVWLSGMRKLYLDDKARGMGARAGRTKLMLYCMAGRVLVQVEQEDGQSVTMITTDEEKPRPMGVQGIYSSLTAAKAMLGEAVTRWKSGLIELKRDDDINMGI